VQLESCASAEHRPQRARLQPPGSEFAH
jgi:hypothetical protein